MSQSPLNTRQRFRVLARDNFRCGYCGATPDVAELHIDHILPRSAGGTNDICNLITACPQCNRGKGADRISEICGEDLGLSLRKARHLIDEAVNELKHSAYRGIYRAALAYRGFSTEWPMRGDEPPIVVREQEAEEAAWEKEYERYLKEDAPRDEQIQREYEESLKTETAR